MIHSSFCSCFSITLSQLDVPCLASGRFWCRATTRHYTSPAHSPVVNVDLGDDRSHSTRCSLVACSDDPPLSLRIAHSPTRLPQWVCLASYDSVRYSLPEGFPQHPALTTFVISETLRANPRAGRIDSGIDRDGPFSASERQRWLCARSTAFTYHSSTCEYDHQRLAWDTGRTADRPHHPTPPFASRCAYASRSVTQ